MFLTINSKISFVKIPKHQTHEIDYQTNVCLHSWSIDVYRTNLIYIKPCKLVDSIYSWKPRSVKRKTENQNMKLKQVCVLWTWAYHTI